jgi:hypothetical protein
LLKKKKKKKMVHDWIAFAKDSIPNFLCILIYLLTYIHVVEVPTETHVCGGGAIVLSKSSLIPEEEEEEEE